MSSIIKNAAIHHSGPPAGFNYTFEQIDQYHKEKWNMRSNLGYYGGYNLAINPQGQMIQFRALGEETIAQKGHNFDTVSICLIGDFSKDTPTWQQKAKLKNVLLSLIQKQPETMGIILQKDTVLDIKAINVLPHRRFQPDTSCYGLRLLDTWATDLLREYLDQKTRLLIELKTLYQKVLELLQARRLGGLPSNCLELDNRG